MKTEDPFDRLVERAAGLDPSVRAAGVCLDAETLAAWADGSLTGREREAAELHTADCERCLAMVAAFAKTAPPPVEPATRSWFSWRWLVPVATAVVVMGVWVLVENPREETRSVAVGAPPSPAIDAVAPASPASAPAASTPAAPAPSRPAPQARTAERSAAKAAVKEEAPAARPVVTPQTAELPRVAEEVRQEARERALAPPPPPPPAQVTVQSRAAAGRGGAAAAPPSANAPAAAMRTGSAFAAPVEIASPDPKNRWRLSALDSLRTTLDGIATTGIARTTDGGVSWTTQPTGIAEVLHSGAAPAPNVCWVVGRNGTVLLTTDGTTWRQLQFPDRTADLVAVSARDALSATVTTADGRIYRTDDGGKTWTVQETPASAF